MLFWKQEKKVEGEVEAFLSQTERCLTAFGEALQAYLADGIAGRFERCMSEIDLFEAAADGKRRDIERAMYGKALIPESRGDILGVLEAVDLVPNKCQSVIRQIWTQSTEMPGAFADGVGELVQANVESGRILCEAVRTLFAKARKVAPVAERVSEKESVSDDIERRLIKAIFDSQIDKADKILLKEVVLEIGAISDRAENAADRLRNIAVKRQS